MITNLIITDDFYTNPDEVREFALNAEYDVRGNYPGQRTQPVHHWASLKETIQKIVQPHGGLITAWEGIDYNTAFQYTTAKDKSWIHSDSWNNWAGVCYLTPDAPVSGGTGLFKHKKTGHYSVPRLENGEVDTKTRDITDKDSQNMKAWDMTAMVGNVYNRLVLYRGDLFHTSLDYFGKGLKDGRLFQTFFFNTQY